MHKQVSDLGAAAYLLMKKYKVVAKKIKSIYFEVSQDKEDEFERLIMDYLSGEFHRFDSCLMSLKKMKDNSDYTMQQDHREVSDLGAAAYVLMGKYKVVAKQGRSVYFDVGSDEQEFEALVLDYLSNEFHIFDSCLMSLKKMKENNDYNVK